MILTTTFCYFFVAVSFIFRISYIPECCLPILYANVLLFYQKPGVNLINQELDVHLIYQEPEITQSLSIPYYGAPHTSVDLASSRWFFSPSKDLSISHWDRSLSLRDYFDPIKALPYPDYILFRIRFLFWNNTVKIVYLLIRLVKYIYKQLPRQYVDTFIRQFYAVNHWMDDQYEDYIRWKKHIAWRIFNKLRGEKRTYR